VAFRLFIARGVSEGQQFVAVQPEVLIGRASHNDVVLADDGVSNLHARIVERDGRFVLEDLGTPSGTFVNGERLDGERELESGDTIGIGPAVLEFGVEREGPVRKKLVPEGLQPASSSKVTGEFVQLPPKGDNDPEVTAPAGRKEGTSRRETDREFSRPGEPTDSVSKEDLAAALEVDPTPRLKLRPQNPVSERTSTLPEGLPSQAMTPPKAQPQAPFESDTDVGKATLLPGELERVLPKLKSSSVVVPPVPRRSVSLAPPVPDEQTIINEPVPRRPGADEPTLRPSAPGPRRPGADEPSLKGSTGGSRSPVADPLAARPSGRHSLVDMTADAVLIDAPLALEGEATPRSIPSDRQPTVPIPPPQEGRPSGSKPVPPHSVPSFARLIEAMPEGSRETVDSGTDPNLRTDLGPGMPPGVEAVTGPMDVKAISDVLVSASVLRKAPDLSQAQTKVRPKLFEAELPTGDEDPDPDATVARKPGDGPKESPAERARRRREAQKTVRGQLGWLWRDLSWRARFVAIVLVLVVAGVIGAGTWQLFQRSVVRHKLPREPTTLTGARVDYSFGLGRVDYERSDFKEFRFEVKAPTPAAVLVHYQAQDISANEVSVAVNGTELGFVPADVGLPDRELELLVSKFVVKRDDTNLVVFDNVRNPPGHERWRISRLWIELIPVPDATREHAVGAAHAAYERGMAIEKQPGGGDELLFKAYRAYREGWLSLLSLPDEERGPLFNEIKQHADALRLKLDSECGALMLEAKKQMELQNPDAAREVLQEVLRNFPARDHPCPSLAEEKLAEYDL
jgi:predicted component of type VI protein secretion system